jgi:hypothetical protein
MTYEHKKVEVLLEVVATRLIEAAAAVNAMREHIQRDDEMAFWHLAIALGNHPIIGGRALTEAQHILLDHPATATNVVMIARPAQEGGMVN